MKPAFESWAVVLGLAGLVVSAACSSSSGSGSSNGGGGTGSGCSGLSTCCSTLSASQDSAGCQMVAASGNEAECDTLINGLHMSHACEGVSASSSGSSGSSSGSSGSSSGGSSGSSSGGSSGSSSGGSSWCMPADAGPPPASDLSQPVTGSCNDQSGSGCKNYRGQSVVGTNFDCASPNTIVATPCRAPDPSHTLVGCCLRPGPGPLTENWCYYSDDLSPAQTPADCAFYCGTWNMTP